MHAHRIGVTDKHELPIGHCMSVNDCPVQLLYSATMAALVRGNASPSEQYACCNRVWQAPVQVMPSLRRRLLVLLASEEGSAPEEDMSMGVAVLVITAGGGVVVIIIMGPMEEVELEGVAVLLVVLMDVLVEEAGVGLLHMYKVAVPRLICTPPAGHCAIETG